MALRQLILSRRIAERQAALKALQDKRDELAARKAAMQAREAELEAAVNEITDTTEESERAEVDSAVSEFETESAALEGEITQNEADMAAAQTEIDGMRAELEELNKRAASATETPEQASDNNDTDVEDLPRRSERREKSNMAIRNRYIGMTRSEFRSFVRGDEMKAFLARVREFAAQKRAVSGGELLIPEVMLPLMREVTEESSKLLRYVNLQPVPGRSRQTVMGSIPEAVWTEMCATLNELPIDFSGVEVDGFKVGGFIAVCNALLKDNDVQLAQQLIYALGRAIGLALDKAIIYGTGIKMPLGILTRLAQTSQPESYPAKARPWVDLHTSNIQVISSASNTAGISLFQSIITVFGAAKKKYGAGGKFFAMNEKTHTKLVTEAMNFNASGAVVTGIGSTMPVIGGDIVELDFMPDGVIVAGYGECYLLAEREGVAIDESEHVRFIEDQTVFRGIARYDGLPVIAEAFVAIGIGSISIAADDVTFAPDEANSVKGITLNTATATVAVGSTIQLFAQTYPGAGTVTWDSGTEAKATVSGGVVTGVATGSSVITATCDGKTAQCTVTVVSA